MESEKEPTPIGKSYFEKHKKPIVISIAIISVVIVLVIPIIPIQYTVTQTRTVKLQYNSQLYGTQIGVFIPKFVNVTNKDSIGGSFSVTMKMWLNNPLGQPQLQDTFTQSSYISAGATHTFNLPEDWIIIEPMYSFTYSVSAPNKQENYNVTKTEYKSILNLIAESLK
jgi:hypothetical protein